MLRVFQVLCEVVFIFGIILTSLEWTASRYIFLWCLRMSRDILINNSVCTWFSLGQGVEVENYGLKWEMKSRFGRPSSFDLPVTDRVWLLKVRCSSRSVQAEIRLGCDGDAGNQNNTPQEKEVNSCFTMSESSYLIFALLTQLWFWYGLRYPSTANSC